MRSAARAARSKLLVAAVSGERSTTLLPNPLAGAGNAGRPAVPLLVEPMLRWVPSGAHVVIVADGALHGINFETLPVPGAARHYWIEDAEIEIAPGLSMLSSARSEREAAAASLLLIGDAAAARPEFPALKYAAAEIGEHLAALPAARRRGVSRAFAHRPRPTRRRRRTGLRSSTSPRTRRRTSRARSTRRSSSSGPEGAYKLYARDVAAVPLHAELVTVSACRSAGARAYSGEGLVGFAWAFLRAGASRVIAGLWDVDDRSTADLMDRLYAGVAAGDTASHALRDAKLAMLAQRRQLCEAATTGGRSSCSPSFPDAPTLLSPHDVVKFAFVPPTEWASSSIGRAADS